MSVGNETRVPPPAMELMAPARNAAPNATAACGMSNAEVNLQDISLHRTSRARWPSTAMVTEERHSHYRTAQGAASGTLCIKKYLKFSNDRFMLGTMATPRPEPVQLHQHAMDNLR